MPTRTRNAPTAIAVARSIASTRGLAAARNEGGTHRADGSATAFARIKSILATGMKNGVRFAEYGIEVVRAKLRGDALPLPLANTS